MSVEDPVSLHFSPTSSPHRRRIRSIKIVFWGCCRWFVIWKVVCNGPMRQLLIMTLVQKELGLLLEILLARLNYGLQIFGHALHLLLFFRRNDPFVDLKLLYFLDGVFLAMNLYVGPNIILVCNTK